MRHEGIADLRFAIADLQRTMNYELNDTIAAVSSPTPDKRVIVRISGQETFGVLKQIFRPSIQTQTRRLLKGTIKIDDGLEVDCTLYLFQAGHSYTGDNLAEIHIDTNSSVIEVLMCEILGRGARIAGPGEFTARAYLNGKMDLAQAEAVNEVITSGNKFQLSAAEKLLDGRLGEQTDEIRSAIMESLSLIEAGMDFSEEDIEFTTTEEIIKKLADIKEMLEKLLAGAIDYESVLGLPTVGLAGVTNAGKSSLLNRLLGDKRSIVSAARKTTRDVLTGLLELGHCRCVLFDCAGLLEQPVNILDELAHQAAVEALDKSPVVLFCVDVSKQDLAEDIAISKLIKPEVLIGVGTKSDLVCDDELAGRFERLNKLFGGEFLVTSAKSNIGIEELRQTIDKKIIELSGNIKSVRGFSGFAENAVGLTARHRQAVSDAIENIDQASDEAKAGNDEIAAMLLRTAYQALQNIEHQPIDEQVLENIFSRFCIGK